jgi:hypothetical protein
VLTKNYLALTATKGGGGRAKALSNIAVDLRKVCNHPSLNVH